ENNVRRASSKVDFLDDQVRLLGSCPVCNIHYAYKSASKPIHNKNSYFFPPYIKNLITYRNRTRKNWQTYRDLSSKYLFNRAQSVLCKEIKKFNQSAWAPELAALNTHDSSLWKTAKRYKSKRSRIPALTTPAIIAFTNSQKAEMLADSYREQFSGNNLSDPETE
ncbi:RNA-directed DNA polymerase from mobile element jockey, partial [Caerostris extrusa]